METFFSGGGDVLKIKIINESTLNPSVTDNIVTVPRTSLIYACLFCVG